MVDDAPTPHDAADDAADDADGRDEASPDDGGPEDAVADGPCTDRERGDQLSAARRPGDFEICPPCADEATWVAWGVVIDATGRAVDVVAEDGRPVPPEIRSCYLEALAGETFPCLTGEEVWQVCYVCFL